METGSVTQRVLRYLETSTSEKHPEWRSVTIRFLSELLGIAEDNWAVNVDVAKVVGLTVFYKDKRVFYIRFSQDHFTLYLHSDWLLVRIADGLFRKRLKSNWHRCYRIDDERELLKLVHYLHRLRRPAAVKNHQSRTIPAWVKEFVRERDNNKCKACGSREALCFDHILPFAKGGLSDNPKNIQLLCTKCNAKKSATLLY